MQGMPAEASRELVDDHRASVHRAMEELLASESFSHSLQSQKLLWYLLEHTLQNRGESLRERVIGVEVFGKPAGYDTNEDSIVRVRANELRKRLAKHYQSLSAPPAVRFSLPPGSYRLEILEQPPPTPTSVVVESAPAPPAVAPMPPPQPSPRKRNWLSLAAIIAALVPLLGFLTYRMIAPQRTIVDQFWQPALDDARPVVICIPHPVLYGLTRDFRKRVTGAPTSHSRNLMEGLELDPNLKMEWRDIVTVRDQFVGVGTTYATAAISSYLAKRNKPNSIRFGNDVSFEDFKNSPTVLLAAFSNRWTLNMTAGWRFVFADANGVPIVKDQTTGRQWSLPSLQPNGKTQEDYAIISRVFQSETGNFLISGAGITQYGTRSAGEVLTNPALLSRALSGLPPGWTSRNLQILIKVHIVGQVPAEPEIVATHQW